MRRFLIDGTIFEHPFTGVAKATLGLYQGVLGNDGNVEITICHRLPLRGEIPRPIKTFQLPASNARVWRAVTLPLHLHRSSYDVVHFPWNGAVAPNLPRRVLKVMTLHDILPLQIPGFLSHPLSRARYVRATGRSLRRADLVITDSEYSRQQILQQFAPSAAPTVIYPASSLVDSNTRGLSTPAPQVAPDEPYFLFCGGYDQRKGIEILLETFVALWRHNELRIPLWIAGASHEYSAYFAHLLQEARALNAVKELGYLPDEELSQVYRSALALLYPSRYEGFGLPPLEAMSLGCPVVTYPLTSLPEVCGDAVLYLDPQRGESLAQHILRLAHDEDLRVRLSKMGQQQAEKFSWAESGGQFLRAIEECLGASVIKR